jgi:hypothetical protein
MEGPTPGTLFNVSGMNKIEFDYIKAQTEFEACTACKRQLCIGDFREYRGNGVVLCFKCATPQPKKRGLFK